VIWVTPSCAPSQPALRGYCYAPFPGARPRAVIFDSNVAREPGAAKVSRAGCGARGEALFEAVLWTWHAALFRVPSGGEPSSSRRFSRASLPDPPKR
jgi:hypothetical protein